MNLKQIFCVVGILACLALTACSKSKSGNNTPAEPMITAKGEAIGAPVTKSIGTAGGQLTSGDGKITMIVPPGAVAQNTNFIIQPITNTLYEDNPSRVAYRLLPEGSAFAQPIKLVFTYDEEELNGTAEDFMTIAWQQLEGTWKTEPCRLDKQAKTLTVETNHFSDWTETGAFELRSKTKLRPGEKVTIRVVGITEDDMLADIHLSDADLASVTSMGNWRILKGGGTLKPIKGARGFETTAEYTATTVNGNVDVIDIAMDIEGFNHIKDPGAPGGVRQTGKMILFTNLIISDNFLTGTLDGTEFGFFGNDVVATGLGGFIAIRASDGSGEITVTTSTTAKGSYPCGQTFLPGKSAVNVLFPPGSGVVNYGTSYIDCGQIGELHFSPSSVHITEWPAVGGMVEGHFVGKIYVADGECGPRSKELTLSFRIVRGA